MTTYTADQIEALGGHRWTKADKDRVYLNADTWAPLIGLETSRYGTGNISGATLDGEAISNARANDILGCIDKVYWDSSDGQIHITGYHNRYFDKVPGWIRTAIAAAVEQGVTASRDLQIDIAQNDIVSHDNRFWWVTDVARIKLSPENPIEWVVFLTGMVSGESRRAPIGEVRVVPRDRADDVFTAIRRGETIDPWEAHHAQ